MEKICKHAYLYAFISARVSTTIKYLKNYAIIFFLNCHKSTENEMTLLPGESQKPLERGSDDGKLELHSLTAPKPQGPGAAGEFLGKPPIYTAALESSLEPQGSLAWGRVAGNPPKAGLVFLDFLVSKNVQRMDLATGGSATERVTGWMSAQQPPRGDLMDRGASPPFQGPPAPPGRDRKSVV